MGQRASNTATISFDEVEIPAENLIGEENKGFKLAMMTLDRTRPGVAAMAVGIARAAFEFAAEYSKERVQFGVPIAMHQAIQFMIADMATKVDAGRLLVWNSAVLLDQGKRNTLVSSEAKRFAADSAMEITVDAVQVYGGYGFIKEYPVEKLMRDAKIMQLYEGTSQIQRLVIAKEVLLPRNVDEPTPEAEAKQADARPRAASPSRQPLTVVAPWTSPRRAAAGKAARSEARSLRPRGVGAARRPGRPGRDPRAPGALPRPGAGPDPLRADGGLALRLLPRRRRGDGRRPRRHAGLRPAGAGLRRRPPLQLRRLRRARPPPRLRPQRLRRDAAGPWEWDVKRLAASFAIAGRENGFKRKERRRRWSLTAARTYREAMRGFAAHAQPRGLVRAPRRRGGAGAGRAPRTPKAVKRGPQGRRQGAGQGQPAGAREAHRTRRRRAAVRQRPAALIVPAEELLPDGESRRPRARSCGGPRRLPRDPAGRPPATCSTATASADLARKVVGVGSVGTRAWVVLLIGRDDGDPLFLQVKEAEASVLEPYAGASRFRQPRPARGRGPAADAGGQRHLPRLVPGGRGSTGASATSTCASSGTGSARSRSRRLTPARPRGLRAHVRLDPGPRPRPLRRPRSRSPPTSAPATPSTARSPSSPSLRRPERARPRRARRGDRLRPRRGGGRLSVDARRGAGAAG